MKAAPLLCSLVLFCGCDKFIDLKFRNNSKDSVVAYVGFSGKFDKVYPDTSVSNGLAALQPIAPNTENLVFDGGTAYRKWQDVFSRLPKDTLSLFVLDPVVVRNTPTDSINKYYRILQRYDLSLNNLASRNYSIEYPYDSTKGTLQTWK